MPRKVMPTTPCPICQKGISVTAGAMSSHLRRTHAGRLAEARAMARKASARGGQTENADGRTALAASRGPNGSGEGHSSSADTAVPPQPSPLPTVEEVAGRGRRARRAKADPPASSSPSEAEDGPSLSAKAAKELSPPSSSPNETGKGRKLFALEASGPPPSPVSPAVIEELQELQVRRKHHIRAATRISNGVGALARRAMGWSPDAPDAEEIKKRAAKFVKASLAGKPAGDDEWIASGLAIDLVAASKQLAIAGAAEREIALRMEKLARGLPAYGFAKSVKGFGDMAFAVLVGEAGDIGTYQPGGSPRKAEKLWKRLGLAPYHGHALSNWRRTGGLTAAEWEYLGYAPRRRAEVYAVIEDPLFRHQAASCGPYHEVYLKRRRRTAETHPDWTKGHSHHDAKRVMVKALISDLWHEWRRAGVIQPDGAIEIAPASTRLNEGGRAGGRMPGVAKLDAPASPQLNEPERARPCSPEAAVFLTPAPAQPKEKPARARRRAGTGVPRGANLRAPASSLADETPSGAGKRANEGVPDAAISSAPAPQTIAETPRKRQRRVRTTSPERAGGAAPASPTLEAAE